MDDAATALAKSNLTEKLLEKHEETCTERYGRIDKSISEIKDVLTTLSTNLRDGISRLHDKREESESVLRQQIAAAEEGAETAIGVEAGKALVAAYEAKKDVGQLKIWILTNGMVVLVAIVGWLADKYFSKVP